MDQTAISFFKFDENVMKGEYGSNRIVFHDFCGISVIGNGWIARFKGHSGSTTDNMVHSVQMDNLGHEDSMG